MHRANLDLAALRASRTQPTGDPSEPTGGDFNVTRRKALGLAGVAAAGISPALRAVEGSVLGTFDMVRSGKGRVAFLYRGAERWVIDTRRFAGSPALRVEQSSDRILVELSRAIYPGTDMPADLRAEIRHGAGGWRIQLKMALGGFSAGGLFVPWLAGLDSLRSRVSLSGPPLRLDPDTALTVAGSAQAAYTPEWVTTARANGIAMLHGLGSPLVSDMVRIAMPAVGETVVLRGALKRTVIGLERGNRAWALEPAMQPAGRWQLRIPSQAFDSIVLELGEDSSRHCTAALVADAGDSITFVPHTGFRNTTGTSVALPLSGARYAIAFDAGGNQQSLVARFGDQPTWLQAGSCAIEVGSLPGTLPFEIHARGSMVTAVRCAPAVLKVSIPIAGAVAAPVAPRETTHLAFVATGLERPSSQHAAQIVLSDHPSSSFQRFTLINPQISVVRPDDLLALTFEFINMRIDTTHTNKPPQAMPRSAKLKPYLAVHFQGQNIAEQAFFQVEQAGIAVPKTAYPGSDHVVDSDATKTSTTNPEFPAGLPVTPVGARLADESRLVFSMPAGFKSMPLTLQTLLDWATLTPSVPPTALPAGGYTTAKIAAPLPTETSLELPWRLKISPNAFSAWVHAFTPVTHNGWTELWHTRLGVKFTLPGTAKRPVRTFLVDTHYAYEPIGTAAGRKYGVTIDAYVGGKPFDLLQPWRTIRASWSADYLPKLNYANALQDNVPFRMSLSGRDRMQLVVLTSDFSKAVPPPKKVLIPLPLPTKIAILPKGIETELATFIPPSHYNPLPAQVDRLMLTTLGAWIDVHGAWPLGVNLGIPLVEWRHRGTQGRDNYVRVVYKGYLFPFGHAASLVKVTERKFYYQNGRNVAYLFQRMFIVVREPIKLFGNTGYTMPLSNGNQGSIDRAMPFKQVEITTKTTPDLDPPDGKGILTLDASQGYRDTDDFWPQIGGKDFQFHLIGQDSDGQRAEFTAPLAFISVENFLAFDATYMNQVRTKYNSTASGYPDRRTRPTNGQKVAFAPSRKPGDTTLHASDITFDAFVPPSPSQSALINADQPRFYPIVATSTVGIPAVEALLHSGQKPKIKLSDHYLQNDLGGTANVGEVFAEILDSSTAKIAFGGSNSGGTGTPGTVTPNLAITALSRVTGPVGGNFDHVAAGDVGDTSGSSTPDAGVGDFLKNFFDNDAKILGAVPLSSIIRMPSLKPLFQILSLVQAVESAPDTLNQLISDAVSKLQGNLAALQAQALGTLQSDLAPLRAALAALQSPLNALHSALTSLPSFVTDLLGDGVGAIIGDLGTLVTDLTSILADLDKLLADLGSANVGALSGDVTALQAPFTSFPTDLKKLVDDLGSLQGINPLPLLKHGQMPTAIDTTLTWSPHLQDFAPFKALDKFLSVTATIHIPLDGSSDPSFSIVGTLGKIGIDLADIIYVGFAGLTFSASSGQKPDVTVPDPGVVLQFEGPLSFVNDLKDAIPADSFTDPPFVDITADGVEAGFTFDLPSLGVGIFSLDNISLGAKVTIPFIGSSPAQVYFNFCTREHPFILTVSMLGGGGFFGISLGLDGLDMLEASFEFGAELSLDFGIASGSVSIMAGIYFKMEKSPKDQTILTGFVHIHGDVEVLGGIISASIDVELDLTYEKDGPDTKVVGEATLTISVHIVFFSITVSASVQRQFSGSHNDPTFADQVTETNWEDYLLAFA